MSAVYFFLFGALGSMAPFLSLYLREAGLSGTEISILLSVSPLLLFVSQPLFGPLTDRSGHRGRMLAALFLAAGAAGALIGLGATFWSFLVVMLLWAFFSGPLVPISDSIALGEVQRTGVAYPRIRLWGSVGWILSTAGMGWLYNSIDLRYMFPAYGLLNLVAFGLARRLPKEGLSPRREVWPVLKELLRNPALIAFLLLTALIQSTASANSAFFGIHLESLGGTKGMVGLASAISAVSEIFVWLVLPRVTRKTGPLPLMALSGLVYGFRWFLTASVTDPTGAIAVPALHGLSFGIFMPTAVVMIGDLVPSDLRTSGQALLVLVNGGIAAILGNLLSGYIVDLAGTAALYRFQSAVALTAGLGFLFLIRRTRQSTARAA